MKKWHDSSPAALPYPHNGHYSKPKGGGGGGGSKLHSWKDSEWPPGAKAGASRFDVTGQTMVFFDLGAFCLGSAIFDLLDPLTPLDTCFWTHVNAVKRSRHAWCVMYFSTPVAICRLLIKCFFLVDRWFEGDPTLQTPT